MSNIYDTAGGHCPKCGHEPFGHESWCPEIIQNPVAEPETAALKQRIEELMVERDLYKAERQVYENLAIGRWSIIRKLLEFKEKERSNAGNG